MKPSSRTSPSKYSLLAECNFGAEEDLWLVFAFDSHLLISLIAGQACRRSTSKLRYHGEFRCILWMWRSAQL